MNLQILLSTMDNDINVLDRENIFSDVVVVNQCGRDHSRLLNGNSYNVHWIDSRTKGLSTSRNLAIKHAAADICLLADDDLVYDKDLSRLVIDEFEKNDTADIIAFIVDGVSGPRKKNWPKEKKLNYLSSMKVSSVQIAFRRNVIIKKSLYFREEFGAGAKYYSGEENIWLWDCLRKGLKIYFTPVKIARLLESESSWFKGYTQWYFVSKGAAFTAMSTALSFILIGQFAVRKHHLWKGDVSFKNSLSCMLKGRAMYLLGQKSVVSKK